MSNAETRDLKDLLTRVPLFADIKPKMMEALQESLEFRRAAPGEVLVRQGEYTENLYVMLRGIGTSYRTEADGRVENMGSHGVEDWFGEMTALANQPQFATVKAETPAILLVIDAPLFKKLYTGGGSFRELIDKRYRERALAVHLRTAPSLRDLSRDQLRYLSRVAELLTFDEGKVIAQEGKPADGVYLIRSGVVKEVRKVDGAPRATAFLRDNSVFGESSILGSAPWESTMIAMTRADVVRIPRTEFDRLLEGDRISATMLREKVDVLEAQRLGHTRMAGIAEISKTAAMDLMVGKQAVKGGEALLIDLNKCTRCNACVEACVSVHEDRVPRLSKRGIRAGDMMLTSACYNCTIPECMMGCNYGAIRRDVNGAIHIILSNCTGCSACEIKCPYGVIRMATLLDPKEAEQERKGFFSRMIPLLLGKRSRPAPSQDASAGDPAEAPAKAKAEKKAIKCDLCAGLPFEACVYNCPCSAISRVDPAEIVGM